MADTKISVATAVVTPAGTDQYATNQGGVSKRTTLDQIATYAKAPLVISGATGAANQGGVGSITYQLITADNPVTTVETVMSTTGLIAGTYLFEYFVVWRSGTTTVGTSFAVDYTGTVTRVRATRWYGSTGASAATGVSDGVSAILTGTVVEHMSTVTDNGALGPNTGVGSISEDQFATITGIMVVSTSANLNLTMTGEGNGAVTLKADTALRLTRLA